MFILKCRVGIHSTVKAAYGNITNASVFNVSDFKFKVCQ